MSIDHLSTVRRALDESDIDTLRYYINESDKYNVVVCVIACGSYVSNAVVRLLVEIDDRDILHELMFVLLRHKSVDGFKYLLSILNIDEYKSTLLSVIYAKYRGCHNGYMGRCNDNIVKCRLVLNILMDCLESNLTLREIVDTDYISLYANIS